MAHLTPDAHRLLATQHGVASTRQLTASGLSRDQVKRLEVDGALTLIVNTVYRSPSAPVTELTRCAAVCLAREGVVIAGPTAGRLWGFRRLPRDHRVHVLAPPASHPISAEWLVAYRTPALRDCDIVHRDDGIRVTSRSRTALDLARWLTPSDVLSVIEQAMRDGGLTDADMYEGAVELISPQRRWIDVFLNQLVRRTPGGPAESHPEVRVAAALAVRGVHGLERQHRITLPGYGAARFDLAVPALRWAIEIDLHPVHEETAGIASDQRRDLAARTAGWDVSRIGRRPYHERFDATIDQLVEEYRHRRLRKSAG